MPSWTDSTLRVERETRRRIRAGLADWAALALAPQNLKPAPHHALLLRELEAVAQGGCDARARRHHAELRMISWAGWASGFRLARKALDRRPARNETPPSKGKGRRHVRVEQDKAVYGIFRGVRSRKVYRSPSCGPARAGRDLRLPHLLHRE